MVDKLKEVGMSIIEIILYIGIIGLCYVMIGGCIVYCGLAEANDIGQADVEDPYIILLIDYLPIFIGSIVGVLIVHQVIFKRPFSFSGFSTKSVMSQFSKGVAWSAIVLTIGFLILFALGWLEIVSVEMNLSLFLGFLLLFFVQSSFEEVAIRSFLLPTLSHRFTIWIGIIVSSVVFALLHFDNQNSSWLSLFNIFIAGILLGVIYIRYKQIWAPIGLHMGWNFIQGTFYGFEVSGFDVYSYIDSTETGPDLWTGGGFGFEGSLLTTILLMSLSVWIWKQAPENFKGKLLLSTQSND